MQEIELNQWARPWIPSYEVTKLSKDVTPDLNHVFMTGRSLKSLQSGKKKFP